jgi:UDP-N-acetylmuramoyl-L-alanyl-D-glutamate--2,6-diaminopimelate ligase
MRAIGRKKIMPTLSELLPELDLPETLVSLVISGLTINSREVKPGYLFVAVKGLQVHGKDFIEQAIEYGAVAVLMDAAEAIEVAIPVVKLPNIEAHLSALAGRFYLHPSQHISVIGITGTNGKTTCSQLLAQCIAFLDGQCGVMGTLGYGVIQKKHLATNQSLRDILIETGMTTTNAITMQKICADLLDKDIKIIAMEVSSHGLSQHRIKDVCIRTAVFTNLSHDHLDHHGSMVAYGQAKLKLFGMSSVTTAVINSDDEFAKNIVNTLKPSVKWVTYGLGSSTFAAPHFSVKFVSYSGYGTCATLITPEGEWPIETSLIGQFNLSNLLAVIATLYVNSYSLDAIIPLLPLLKPVAGRMEIVPNTTDIQVIVDYAHTPDALKNVLTSLALYAKGKLWCVFGCGGDRDREKRPKMAAIAESLADEVILTSDNPRTESLTQIFSDIEAGFSKPRNVIVDRAQAIDFAIKNAAAGDIVLIAGKGHENYQLVGKQRIYFCDVKEAQACLSRRAEKESTL